MKYKVVSKYDFFKLLLKKYDVPKNKDIIFYPSDVAKRLDVEEIEIENLIREINKKMPFDAGVAHHGKLINYQTIKQDGGQVKTREHIQRDRAYRYFEELKKERRKERMENLENCKFLIVSLFAVLSFIYNLVISCLFFKG